MTKLLVSVRSDREAKTALLAGADLIDAKEPECGPLGSCDESTWESIAATIGERRPLSAALGEWFEWAMLDDAEATRRLSKLSRFRYAKLGPGRSGSDDARGWCRTFERLKSLGPQTLGWIAVIYADGESCGTADREVILRYAVDCGCEGVLIDTCDKSRQHFWGLGWDAYVRRIHAAGLPVAIAGGLTKKSMKRIDQVEPDWFAVRGAACIEGDRSERVSYRKVRSLVDELRERYEK